MGMYQYHTHTLSCNLMFFPRFFKSKVHDSSMSTDGMYYLVTNSNDKECFVWELDDHFWGDYTEDWDDELLTETASVNFVGNDRIFENQLNDLKTKYESELQKVCQESKLNQIRLEKGKSYFFLIFFLFFSDFEDLQHSNKILAQENDDLRQMLNQSIHGNPCVTFNSNSNRNRNIQKSKFQGNFHLK
jgi:hypothetical protein